MLLKGRSHTHFHKRTHTRASPYKQRSDKVFTSVSVFVCVVAKGSKSAVLEVEVLLSCGGGWDVVVVVVGGGARGRVSVAATDNDVIPA